jgi:nitrile hydratase subunit beta
MNGPHDLGGQQGFGPVRPEADEPPWHHEWEAQMHVLALSCQVRGLFVLDEQRHSLERLPRAMYLHSSYYERWFRGVSGLLVDKGIINQEDLDARVEANLESGNQRAKAAKADPELEETLVRVLYDGASAMRDTDDAPRFKPGDRVVAKNLNVPTHHRLPSYAKGKPGVVEASRGAFTLNDSLAHGHGESPTHVYTVAFKARDLWGDEAAESPDDVIYTDMFETYLLPRD